MSNSKQPTWPGHNTVLTTMNQQPPGRNNYGSLPTTTIRHDSQARNGAQNDNAYRQHETTSAFATFGNTQELSKKEVDWTVVTSTGRILMIGAVFALLIAIGLIIGASFAASVSLFVNAACVLAVFARQLFLLFVLSVAGVSTIRASYYKTRKIQLLISLCANLVAFLILGGSLYIAIRRLVTGHYYVVDPIAFLATSVFALPLLAILCGVLSISRKLDNQNVASKLKVPKAKPAQGSKAAMVSGFSRFSKERGLILRRTLNRVSIRSNYFLTLILLVQALIAFITALIAYFKPHTLMSDSIIAIIFMPLAIVMTISLLWDVITVMTEGILQGVDFGEIAEALINIDGVTAVRHLRIWSMKTDEVSLSVQIAIDDNANFDTVLRSANELLKTKYDIYQYKIDSTDDQDEDIDI